jgi:Uma2 family endonuclease
MVMTTAAVPSARHTYANLAELWHALGEVPLERIVMNPLPGTATERDLQIMVERDKRLVELIDGTLVEKPAGYLESLIASWLIKELGNFVDERNLGYVSGEAGMIRMRSGRVRLPDVAFVSIEDLPEGKLPLQPIPTLPPTLAVEVLSDTNTKLEIRQKLKEYFESGTRLAWIIDPKARTVAVYDKFSDTPAQLLQESETLEGRDVLPGFALPIARLFARLPK